ncbi:MAG: DUF2130 domain-containing protein [Nitrospina sp.]|nr:MAG: DUF2130 domain-containing protein [Nitrospina sp.]
MAQQSKKIKCPNCEQEIDVNDILYQQVDEEIRKKYRDELKNEKNKYQRQLDSLSEEKEQFKKEKEQQNQKVAEAIKKGIKNEEKQLRMKIKTEIQEEQSDMVKILKEDLSEKSSQLKEFNKAKSTIERLKREKDELRDSIEAESQKKFSEIIVKEKERIRKNEEEKSQLKLLEKENLIEQLSTKLKEAQRKVDQGSMQVQGEVLELAIEGWLRDKFPLDNIEEIKKGAKGADILQIVNTRDKQNCGTIYYESKRTKGFQPAWIEKFKNDIREKKASIGVLITETMPADMERMGLRDGVWICTFEEFKGLCLVLRQSIIQVSNAITAQENKGEKTVMLYNFLTGMEFHQQVEGVVEGFTQMRSDLDSEKRAVMGNWKKREKQIEKVVLNTINMYSSIRGIAGNAVQSVPLLEMFPGEDEGGNTE